MKKILSLVLAVLMLASLAISASAATVNNPFKNDSNDKVFESLLDYYMWYYVYGGTDEELDAATSVWYDKCPQCSNVAMFFEGNGRIIWTCLYKECNKTGFYPIVNEDDSAVKLPTSDCPMCHKDDNVIYLSVSYEEGKYYYNFFCTVCHKLFNKEDPWYNGGTTCPWPDYNWCGNCHQIGCTLCHYYWTCPYCRPGCDEIDPGFTYPDYPTHPGFNPSYRPVASYNCFACGEKLELQYYSNINGTYYGFYKCSAGHVYTLPYYASVQNPQYPSLPIIPEGNYRVRVIATEGGTYSFSDDKAYGKLGTYKAITFTPNAGYVVDDVVINDKSVGATTKLFFEIEGPTTIKVYFKKAAGTTPSVTGKYTVTASTNGKGSVEVYKNGAALSSATVVGANKNDTLTYKFVPSSKNYYVSSVIIDGTNVGAIESYTFKKLDANHSIIVEFAWKSPFTFISPAYMNAVEYVTETGIMSATKVEGKKAYFSGTNAVTIKDFASALAEMCDVKGELDTDAEKAFWALKNGLILTTDDENAICNVQTACRIIKTYLTYIEGLNGVSFVDFDADASAMENGISIGLVTEKGYNGNRNLTRYDLAAVCYMIKQMAYSIK